MDYDILRYKNKVVCESVEQGIIIPSNILGEVRDGFLNPTEALVLAVLELKMDRKAKTRPKGCYLSNKKLGWYIGVGPRQIQRILSHLRDKKVIKIRFISTTKGSKRVITFDYSKEV